jgi:integrase
MGDREGVTDMMLDFPYLKSEPDRHGNDRLYVRRHDRKIRLREKPGTRAFIIEYNAGLKALEDTHSALNGVPSKPHGLTAATPYTLGWLIAKYKASGEFGALDAKSRAARSSMLDVCALEPRHHDAPDDLMRDCPLKEFTSEHGRMLRDRVKGQPGAANNRRKHLSAMFGWAADTTETKVKSNPMRDVRPIKSTSAGYYPWTIADLTKFEDRHPIGTKARLAVGLLLFLGPRRQDMVGFGKQHVREGVIGFVPKKTRHIRPETSYKPVLPILADIIAASPCGDLTFLVTAHGKPFTANGFGNKMREWCNQAGLPQCTAHGLRKLGATIAAENGATLPQLMSIFDWSTPGQAMKYIKAADRKRMAGQAMGLLASGHSENGSVAHLIGPPEKTAVSQ